MQLPPLDTARHWEFARLSQCLLDFQSHHPGRRQITSETIAHWTTLIDLLFDKAQECPSKPKPPPLPELTKKDKRKWAEGRGVAWQSYQKLYNKYRAQLFTWEEEAPTSDPVFMAQWRIAENRKRELQHFLESDQWPPVERKIWTILPPGEWPRDLNGWWQIVRPTSEWPPQPERLYHALQLDPSKILRGCEGDFDTYAAFLYPNTGKVLLESIDYGNAAYVLSGDWEKLSRLTKFELYQFHRHEVRRIFHRDDGDWRTTIRLALNL